MRVRREGRRRVGEEGDEEVGRRMGGDEGDNEDV